MQPPAIVFNAKEILQQIHRELIVLEADTVSISVDEWKEYIIARTIEDVLMVDLTPVYNRCMENIAVIVRSNYRRVEGEETFTLNQDVGSNKLFPNLSSSDLSFESKLELHRHCVVISPRKPAP